ncbi:hypothetical protein [Vulcanisaeta souniana]|uniref:hypothetical protein n=1 Tax=Vulcanisaeta souniana TaxID=164452 RepID=UPI000B2AA1B8|nr:hypothetical protein [Vulcanisaeta souniana]
MPSLVLPIEELDPAVVRDWLVSDYGPVWDYGVRAYLLRDVGSYVVGNYGTTIRLFNASGVEDLIDRLSLMAAYEDPVRKKAYLLIKFLALRGYSRLGHRK